MNSLASSGGPAEGALRGSTNGSLLLIGTGRDVWLNRLMTRSTFIDRGFADARVVVRRASTSATNTSEYAGADAIKPGRLGAEVEDDEAERVAQLRDEVRDAGGRTPRRPAPPAARP